jgi:hypothetical protein
MIEKFCVTCNIGFQTNTKRKYCSERCSDIFYIKQRNKGIIGKEQICECCEKIFIRTGAVQKYCSKECAQIVKVKKIVKNGSKTKKLKIKYV